jgi:hypothetical protein
VNFTIEPNLKRGAGNMALTDLTTASIVAHNDNILHAEIDQVVALSVTSGTCYGLNTVGSRIWHLMAKPVRVGDLCDALQKEFDVDHDTCEREVLDLLKEALAEGMIKIEAGAPAESAQARA